MKYVIAPKNMHLSILNYYRQNDPFFDIKLIDKNELEKYIYPLVKKEAIIYLMSKYKYTYETSKMYISYLPYLTDDSFNQKFLFLNQIKNELIEEGYITELKAINKIKNIETDIIGYYKDDIELEKDLSVLNIKANYVTNSPNNMEHKLYGFEKIEEEVYFVLNEIATLLDNGVNVNDIYILNRDANYNYYLKKYAPTFGYQINLMEDDNFASTGAYKEFSKLYKNNHDVELSLSLLKEEIKDDPIYDEIASIIKENDAKTLSFEENYDYLYHILLEKKIKKDRYKHAIEVIKNPLFVEGKNIFVMGFSQGLYPRSGKDSGFLANHELDVLKRNNVKRLTHLDADFLLDFFYSNNYFHFSFSSKSLKSHYFLSPLAKDLNLSKPIKPNVSKVFYSKDVINNIYTNLKDFEYFYRDKKEDLFRIRDVVPIKYNNYDNSYKYKVDAFNQDSYLRLSTTQLDLYSKCPFHYFLTYVIKLDEVEETSAIRLGIITHYIFEHMRDTNFDFDKTYQEKLEEYELEPLEKLLLETTIKEQIQIAIEAIKEREKYYKNPKTYNEISLTYKIDNNTCIIGKVDNLVILDDKYFICVDYKTGSTSSTKFSEDKLQYGISSQLPTYTLLTSGDDRFSDLKIAGVYLNHVISSSLTNKKNEDDLIYDYLKLHGKSLNDLNVFSYIDSTIADGKSNFVSAIKITKNNVLSSMSGLASEEQFENYKTITEDLFKSLAANIRNNDFKINPIFFNSQDEACMYCPFKDVCYRKSEQYREIVKQEAGEENG